MAVHQFAHPAYVYVYRAQADTATTSHTLDALIVFVHIVLEFVHEPLSNPVALGSSGVVARSVQGKQWKHATVPIPHALAIFAAVFILNVKAPASGAYKSAGPAINA